jgi:hypothetical protein
MNYCQHNRPGAFSAIAVCDFPKLLKFTSMCCYRTFVTLTKALFPLICLTWSPNFDRSRVVRWLVSGQGLCHTAKSRRPMSKPEL